MNAPARKPGALAKELFAELAIGGQQETAALATKLQVSRRQISNAAALLKRHRLLKTTRPGLYGLTKLGRETQIKDVNLVSGPKASYSTVRAHKDTFRARAWRSMRIRGRFTIGDILADAERDDEADAKSNAQRYISALCRVGHVRELPKRRPGTSMGSNGQKVFRLSKNTGPLAPVWREKSRVLHDFNTGEDYPCLKD